MYAFFKENTTLNISNLGLKIGDVVTVICVGAGGGGGGGGSTTYHNSKYPGTGGFGANAGFIFNNNNMSYISGMGYGAGGAGGYGGEGGGTMYNGAGGGGGGAGQVVIKTIVLKQQTIPITIGERGIGGRIVTGAKGNGINGTNGGASSFGSYVTSRGGAGGGGGGGSSNNFRGRIGAGGWSGGYTWDSPGRGANGGNGNNVNNVAQEREAGRGAGGFLPFLVGTPRNGNGSARGRDVVNLFSPFSKEKKMVDFTYEDNCNTYLGGINGTNNFGRGLVMLLWD